MKIKNLKECEEALNELQKEDAELLTRTAKANTDIAVIREGALEDIAELEERITKRRNAIEAFANGNRENEEIFIPTRKSVSLHAGDIGYSDDPEKIVLRDGYTEAEVIKNAKEAKLKDLVKTGKETLDKTAAKKHDDKTLTKLGLRREQTESFYIKLNTLKEA